MRRWIITASLIAASLLFETWAAAQQETPVVEITVTPQEVAVGEPLRMQVSVYVPTWFTKAPVFPSFEIPNAITRLPPDSSHPSTKRIGNASWSGITRNYEIHPLMGARFRMESQTIVVHQADPGKDPIRKEVPTGEITFRAYVPAGAEGIDPYVAGSRLEITRSIEGDTSALAVGDAVVATYTAELEGLSSMFLPELIVPADTPGVSVYPEQADIEDEDGVARRTEKVTFIFNAGGEYTIPGASVDWWNRDAGRVETSSVAPLTLTVEGPLLTSEPADEPDAERNWFALIVAAAVLYWLLRRTGSRLASFRLQLAEKERMRRASEPYAWEMAKKALAGKDAHKAHDAMVCWLARLEPGLDSHSFAANYGDDELVAELGKLNGGLYNDGSDAANLGRISRHLSAARKRYLAEHNEDLDVVLPPLNP